MENPENKIKRYMGHGEQIYLIHKRNFRSDFQTTGRSNIQRYNKQYSLNLPESIKRYLILHDK